MAVIIAVEHLLWDAHKNSVTLPTHASITMYQSFTLLLWNSGRVELADT